MKFAYIRNEKLIEMNREARRRGNTLIQKMNYRKLKGILNGILKYYLTFSISTDFALLGTRRLSKLFQVRQEFVGSNNEWEFLSKVMYESQWFITKITDWFGMVVCMAVLALFLIIWLLESRIRSLDGKLNKKEEIKTDIKELLLIFAKSVAFVIVPVAVRVLFKLILRV